MRQLCTFGSYRNDLYIYKPIFYIISLIKLFILYSSGSTSAQKFTFKLGLKFTMVNGVFMVFLMPWMWKVENICDASLHSNKKADLRLNYSVLLILTSVDSRKDTCWKCCSSKVLRQNHGNDVSMKTRTDSLKCVSSYTVTSRPQRGGRVLQCECGKPFSVEVPYC